MTTIASPWLIFIFFASGVIAPLAQAQNYARRAEAAPVAQFSPIEGVYNGSYAGDQGPTKFKLSLTETQTILTGVYTVYLPDGSGTNAYTCELRGQYIQVRHQFFWRSTKWETMPPSRAQVGMTGVFDPTGGQGAGQIAGRMFARPGPEFTAIRDAAESADMASVMAAQKAAGPPAVSVAQASPSAARRPGAAPSLTPSPTPGRDIRYPGAISGVYIGTYGSNPDDRVTAKLYVKCFNDGYGSGNLALTGLFTLDIPPSLGATPITYTCKLTGRYQGMFGFGSGEPLGKPVPDAYAVKNLELSFAQDPWPKINPNKITSFINQYNPPRNTFEAVRDEAESAKLDSLMAALTSAAGPVVSTTATAPSSPLPGSSRAPGSRVASPSAFNGVYTGTYGRGGNMPAKLFIKSTDDGSLTGLFTFDLPVSYTYKLTGRYVAGDHKPFQFTTAEPLGKRAPKGYEVTAVSAWLQPGSPSGAPNPGARDWIYARVNDSYNFSGPRDKADSADLDKLMAAQASAAGPVVSTTGKPAARLNPNNIAGVYNGTYTRTNEPPAKLKLTITRTPDGRLAGVATIYLPTDSGSKAYTYTLNGTMDPHGAFHLFVNDWYTTPPKDFKNFKAMGFMGEYRPNVYLNTARIVSAESFGSLASFCVPKFEARWDATESANIMGTITAQESIGAADKVAAMKAREEMMRNAPPKQLASNDLVRKSWAYWDNYQTDMIREVFDGGFGAAMDENEKFQRVFLTYVGTFSAKCPECLPPNHQTVTVNELVGVQVGGISGHDTDGMGRLVSSATYRTYTVEMDPRFVAKFNQFHAAVNSLGAGLSGLAAIAQPGGVQSMLHDRVAMVNDMLRFFADHAGKSAAMRQLTENFLRAINGEPSLQQSGGKIDGAQAESDKNLPPGRYARFVDGANAYYRELDNRDSAFGNSASHDTAFCQRLAELYESYMSPEEQYYYANDFGGRFIPIMGPHSACSDPAWTELHPDVDRALAEIK